MLATWTEDGRIRASWRFDHLAKQHGAEAMASALERIARDEIWLRGHAFEVLRKLIPDDEYAALLRELASEEE